MLEVNVNVCQNSSVGKKTYDSIVEIRLINIFLKNSDIILTNYRLFILTFQGILLYEYRVNGIRFKTFIFFRSLIQFRFARLLRNSDTLHFALDIANV